MGADNVHLCVANWRIAVMDKVARFQLLAARGAIKLEAIGMRHSSGRSARTFYAKLLGMKPRSSHKQVIMRITELLAEDEQNAPR